MNYACTKMIDASVFLYFSFDSSFSQSRSMGQAVPTAHLTFYRLAAVIRGRKVIESWKQFIHTHHYSCHTNFFDTTLARCPRRSCEATFDRLMNCIWLDGSKGFKEGMSFSDIDEKTYKLIAEETANKGTMKSLSNPYH